MPPKRANSLVRIKAEPMSIYDEIPLRPPLTEQSLSFAQRLGGNAGTTQSSNAPPRDPMNNNSLANRLSGNTEQRRVSSDTERSVNNPSSNATATETTVTNINGNSGPSGNGSLEEVTNSTTQPHNNAQSAKQRTVPTEPRAPAQPVMAQGSNVANQVASQSQGQQNQQIQSQPHGQQNQQNQQAQQASRTQQPQSQAIQPDQQSPKPQQIQPSKQVASAPHAAQKSTPVQSLPQRPEVANSPPRPSVSNPARVNPVVSKRKDDAAAAKKKDDAAAAKRKEEVRHDAVLLSASNGKLSIDLPGGLAYNTNAVMSEMERARAQDLIAVLNGLPNSLTAGQFIKEYYNETTNDLKIGTSFDSFEENPFRKALRRVEESIYKSPYQRLEYLAIAIYQLHPFKSAAMTYIFQKYLQQLAVSAGLSDEEVTALQGHQDVGSIVLALNRPHTSYKTILRHYARMSDARPNTGAPTAKEQIEDKTKSHKMTEAEFLARMKVYFTPNEFGLEALRLELAKHEPGLELTQLRQRLADYAAKLFVACYQTKTPREEQSTALPFAQYADLPADDKSWAEFYGLICERTFQMHPAVARDPLYKNGYPGGGRMKLLVTFMLRKYNLKIEDFVKKTPRTELAYDLIMHHFNTVLPRVALNHLNQVHPGYYKDSTQLNPVLSRIAKFSKKEALSPVSDARFQELGYVLSYPASNATVAGSLATFSSHFTDPNSEMAGNHNLPKINISVSTAGHFRRGQRLRLGSVGDDSPGPSEQNEIAQNPQPVQLPKAQRPQAPAALNQPEKSQTLNPQVQPAQPAKPVQQPQPTQPKQPQAITSAQTKLPPTQPASKEPAKQKLPPTSSEALEPPAKRLKPSPSPKTIPPPAKSVPKPPPARAPSKAPSKPAPKSAPKNFTKPVPIPKIAPKPIPKQAPQRFSPPSSPRGLPPWVQNNQSNNNGSSSHMLSGHQLSRPSPPWASQPNPRFSSHPQTRSTRRPGDSSNQPSRPPWKENNFRDSSSGGGGLSARLQPRE